MNGDHTWREALIELGLVAVVLGILASVAALIGGSFRSLFHHGKGKSQSPPSPGEVPNQRHENTGAVSTR